MDFIDGLWHLLGFIMPALALGCLTAGLAKLLWRAEFLGVSWVRLATGSSVASALGYACCIVWLGQDGRMIAYAVTLACCATGTWCFARRPG